MSGFPILSVMLLVPLLGAVACFFANASAARTIALVATVIDLALGVVLWANFDVIPGDGVHKLYAECGLVF